MAKRWVQLKVLLSEEQIEQATAIAAQWNARFPNSEPWTWREWLACTAQAGIKKSLEESGAKQHREQELAATPA